MAQPAPQFKTSITHSAVTTDYVNDMFTSIQVKRPENRVSSALFMANNYQSKFYPDNLDRLDTIQISQRPSSGDSWVEVFDGVVMNVTPMVEPKHLVSLACKGLGHALAKTHCNTSYGSESVNDTLETPKEIWDDLVDNYINKSFGTATATGYAITKTRIADINNTLDIAFLNAPYQTCEEVINRVCMLNTADEAGAASCHWFVDVSGNLFINTIGAHEDAAQWPNYWGGSQAASTLVEGVDFHRYQVPLVGDMFANKIVFVTDMRKPGYDYLTEDSGGQALWGNDGLTSITDSAAEFVVGSHSLLLTPNGNNAGYAYYPAGGAAEWDVTSWGSEYTVPHLSFYMYKNGNITEASCNVYMSNNDTARKTDYFYVAFSTWTEPDNEWVFKSIPIGPYWRSGEESKLYRWTNAGAALDWTDIDTVEFMVSLSNGGLLYIDDLHFTGKLIREAKNSTSITANDEYQAVVVSRAALDDSMIASDDSGTAGRYAYAELLRRQKLPKTIQFTVQLKNDMLPGQFTHVHAGKTSSGSFNVNEDFRVTEVMYQITMAGHLMVVTATNDLTNSFPVTGVNRQEILNEYLLLNNKESKDLRGTGVDLLISHLVKDYP